MEADRRGFLGGLIALPAALKLSRHAPDTPTPAPPAGALVMEHAGKEVLSGIGSYTADAAWTAVLRFKSWRYKLENSNSRIQHGCVDPDLMALKSMRPWAKGLVQAHRDLYREDFYAEAERSFLDRMKGIMGISTRPTAPEACKQPTGRPY